jgi:hypothetical protein
VTAALEITHRGRVSVLRLRHDKANALGLALCIDSMFVDGEGADSSALNHGVSLSFFFADPERHLLKIYWPTGIPASRATATSST